jgi:hypothetical protein
MIFLVMSACFRSLIGMEGSFDIEVSGDHGCFAQFNKIQGLF